VHQTKPENLRSQTKTYCNTALGTSPENPAKLRSVDEGISHEQPVQRGQEKNHKTNTTIKVTGSNKASLRGEGARHKL